MDVVGGLGVGHPQRLVVLAGGVPELVVVDAQHASDALAQGRRAGVLEARERDEVLHETVVRRWFAHRVQTHPNLRRLHVGQILVDSFDEGVNVEVSPDVTLSERRPGFVRATYVGLLVDFAGDAEFDSEVQFVDGLAELLGEVLAVVGPGVFHAGLAVAVGQFFQVGQVVVGSGVGHDRREVIDDSRVRPPFGLCALPGVVDDVRIDVRQIAD